MDRFKRGFIIKGVLGGALLLCLVLLGQLWLQAKTPNPAPTSPQTKGAIVASVIDGDSLLLRDQRKLRLIGLNAPERGRDGRPAQPLAQEARAALQKLIGDQQQITYITDAQKHDRYGRLLAHVYLPDGRNLQEQLLRQGMAWQIAIPPNLENLSRYQAAESSARRSALGVWRHPAYRPRPASGLDLKKDTGFQLVKGRIERSWRSRKYLYFELASNMNLRIAHEHWHYFNTEAQAMIGQQVIARGWLSNINGKLSMRIGHPIMLERLP